MLYVNGINKIVKNDGIAISALSHSISLSEEHINDPTIISAGAVTADVITVSNGEKNNETKNNPPTTTLENPVFAPTEAPDNDSTYDVVLVVPNIDPIHVAIESANNAFEPFSIEPSFLRSPTFEPTATNVPAVSKKSINKKVNITRIISGLNIFPKFLIAAPKVGAIDGGIDITDVGISISPVIIPTIAVNPIPKKIAILEPLTINIEIAITPNIESKTVGSVKSPRPTKVAELATTIPAFFNPIKAMNNPIPALTANFKLVGIALIIISLKPVADIIKNIIPEANTPDNAISHLIPIPKHTLYAKNAFKPTPGANPIGKFAKIPIISVPKAAASPVATNTLPCGIPASASTLGIKNNA